MISGRFVWLLKSESNSSEPTRIRFMVSRCIYTASLDPSSTDRAFACHQNACDRMMELRSPPWRRKTGHRACQVIETGSASAAQSQRFRWLLESFHVLFCNHEYRLAAAGNRDGMGHRLLSTGRRRGSKPIFM